MIMQLATRPVVTACLLAIPASMLAKHAFDVYSRIAPTPRDKIVTVNKSPESFNGSRAVAQLVNPRKNVSINGTIWTDLGVAGKAGHLSDEALLAAFARGFFGGKVFAIERSILRLVRQKIVFYDDLDRSPTDNKVWDVEALETDALPPVETVLFGGFQVGDISLVPPTPNPTASDPDTHAPSESSIDVVFGSGKGQFGGVHRFSVLRGQGPEGTIRISYAHMACNPTVDKPLKPDVLLHFHNMYAMLLFRDAVTEVSRRLERS